MPKFRALEAAENVVWAMEQSALETLLTIAAREHDITQEALEAYQAQSLQRAEQATVRDGIAIITANGPLFKRANLMTAFSGATSYDIMRKDIQAAVDNPAVKGAILSIDSPGGDAGMVAELANYISSLRGTFPVTAYISDMGASAAYWLASAAQEVVIAPTATLGSIGVQMAMRTREDPKGVTTHTFVSSQSPMKNADPGTEEGAKHMQSVVDAMAQVFVSTVASNRGVDPETVLSNFGKGGILVGQDAVNAGLADRIGNFEGLLAEMSGGLIKVKPKGAKMADETFSKADLDAAVATAVAQSLATANARTASITAIGTNLGATAAEIAAAIAAGTDPLIFATEQSVKSGERQQAAIAAAVEAASANAKAGKQSAAIAALQTDEEAAAAAAASNANDAAPVNERQALIARIAAA